MAQKNDNNENEVQKIESRKKGMAFLETMNTVKCGDFKPSDFALTLEDNSKYLEVKFRIAWFNLQNPDGRIITEIVNKTEASVTVKASVYKTQGDTVSAVAHAEKTYAQGITNDMSPLDWAETAAIGRALNLCGYGTVFCGSEMLEDLPCESPVKPLSDDSAKPKTGLSDAVLKKIDDLRGKYISKDGKMPEEFFNTIIHDGFFKGKKFKSLFGKNEPSKTEGYFNWIINSSKEENEDDVIVKATAVILYEAYKETKK